MADDNRSLADVVLDATDLGNALLTQKEPDLTGAKLASLLAEVAIYAVKLRKENKRLRGEVEALSRPWWRRLQGLWDVPGLSSSPGRTRGQQETEGSQRGL